ncbi:MAG: Rieske (2Fe-2S) protein [Candidatus Kapaibacterium sp.]|nr:MAG: Rieske (2Fe-2S) protein [Candidatus Kapabacteria bacterium]
MNTTTTTQHNQEQIPDTERRDFLTQAASMLGLAVSAGTIVSLVNACEQPNTTGGSGGSGSSSTGTLDLASETALQSVGGAIRTTINRAQIIVIRTSQTQFLALAALCTHAGCGVGMPANGVIECRCHGSRFSAADGSVLNGPAVMPLRSYRTTFNSMTNILTINLA